MTRSEKTAMVDYLKEKFDSNSYFYLTDASTLTVEQVNKLRGLCFEKGVEMKVVKNTLAQKAMEALPEEKNFAELYSSLKGPTAIMFCETANLPAKVIKEFRKAKERPILKAAYIETAVFIGDDQLDSLAALKSREELIGDVVGLLQSPAKNALGALQSGGNTLTGLLKTLGEREG